MSNTISPNMGLIVPGVGTEPGPQWATDLNASLSIIDAHNHSSGQGVQITPNGLNINSDLAFQSNNATQLRSTRFTSQGAVLSGASDIGCLYVVGNELYYNDVTGGHNVQITSNGNVNATSSGISSGTASAAFSAGVLVVKSSSSSFANIDMQSAVLANSGNITDQLTLQAPSLSGSYSLTLPYVPASQSFMSVDASGNMAAYAAVAGGLTYSNMNTQVQNYLNKTPTVTTLFSGSGTYTPPSGCTYIKFKMTGAGGGGSGSGSSAGSGATNGGDTTFGSFTAGGGGAGTFNSAPGAGGITIVPGGFQGFHFSGGPGGGIGAGQAAGGANNSLSGGGSGGTNSFGSAGGGSGSTNVSNGGAGIANTGAGGGGAGAFAAGHFAGSGGGAGGYIEGIVGSPSSMSYSIGSGGLGDTGSGGSTGGSGGSGGIIIEEHYGS